MKNSYFYILFFLFPLLSYSQNKAIECYNTAQYGMVVEKCTYQMEEGDVLQFDNYEIYICQIQTYDQNGLKCEIKYKNGDIEINSNGIINPLIEEIPDNDKMKKITYENSAWKYIIIRY